MAKQETCPTCGTALGALHCAEMRSCNGCLRLNPVGFIFCGYCAAPMERTESRAKVAELAAPAGGWPNLSDEMAEVRFFMQQGELDEAYELLSILQRRYPGHPELADVERHNGRVKADAATEALVDDVLANSSSLAGKAPRRRATRWEAPTVSRKPPTQVHDPVDQDILEELATPDQVVKIPSAEVALDLTNEARPIRERTMVYNAVGPKPGQSGMTIAVDALQPAAPYPVPEAPSETAETQPRGKKPNGTGRLKKARKKALSTSRKRKLESNAKRKGTAFGAGVLGRFGR